MANRRKRPRDPAQLAKFIIDVATGEVDDTPGKAPNHALAVALFAMYDNFVRIIKR